MIIEQREARPLMAWKGKDWKYGTDEERVEFALSPVGEGGMDSFDLQAMLKALHLIEKKGSSAVIVETGFGWGYSARLIITHVLQHGGAYHSVDIIFRDQISQPLKDLCLFQLVNTHQHDSRTFKWEGGLIDFLNIDSEHSLSFVLAEYMCFRPYLAADAIIGFHDVNSCPGVREGIEVIKKMDKLELVARNESTASFGYEAYRLLAKDQGI